MFQRACGATAGSCTEPENEKDSIVLKPEKEENNLNQIDCSEFDILKAVQYNSLTRVKELVEEHGNDVNKPDSDTVSLLHWAAINNRREIIKYLIEKGANVNAIGGGM
jgi:palmitoyltransferase ZDHHC13/17